jgi:hypothetical protein
MPHSSHPAQHRGSAGLGGELTFSAMASLTRAVRHKLPLLCVISLNGGWTADFGHNKPGRDLGHTRYDKVVGR